MTMEGSITNWKDAIGRGFYFGFGFAAGVLALWLAFVAALLVVGGIIGALT